MASSNFGTSARSDTETDGEQGEEEEEEEEESDRSFYLVAPTAAERTAWATFVAQLKTAWSARDALELRCVYTHCCSPEILDAPPHESTHLQIIVLSLYVINDMA